jgi:hypothetical protein
VLPTTLHGLPHCVCLLPCMMPHCVAYYLACAATLCCLLCTLHGLPHCLNYYIACAATLCCLLCTLHGLPHCLNYYIVCGAPYSSVDNYLAWATLCCLISRMGYIVWTIAWAATCCCLLHCMWCHIVLPNNLYIYIYWGRKTKLNTQNCFCKILYFALFQHCYSPILQNWVKLCCCRTFYHSFHLVFPTGIRLFASPANPSDRAPASLFI